MNAFFEWFGRNRKTIGYTVGSLNIFGGLISLLAGNIFDGVIILSLGILIIFCEWYSNNGAKI